MKKIKSLLITVASMSAVALPVVASVSCGGPKVQDAQWPQTKVTQISLDNKVTKEVVEAANVQTFPSIAVITDSGLWDDKSFNQSSVEGALTFRDQINKLFEQKQTVKDKDGKDVEVTTYPEGKSVKVNVIQPTEGQYPKTYDTLLAGGSKVWILSGFQHQSPLSAYLKSKKAQLEKNGIIIIGIDFAIEDAQYANFYSLSFKVQESAYIVGQAIAEYLGNNADAAKRTTTSFGGGAFPGVTNFITGYLKGILNYDTANAAKATKITGETATPTSLPLNTDFKPSDKMTNTINTLLAQHPSVILPVAGSATGKTLTSIRDQKLDTKVIGVDVDQTLSYPDLKGYLMTSITKNVGQAIYDTLLYSIFGIDNKKVFASFNKDAAKNVNGSYKQGWVGYSKSSLADEAEAAKVNALLDKYGQAFSSLSEDEINYVDGGQVVKGDNQNLQTGALIDALIAKINATK
ncbi:BMP family ABC transporter substrate-binding protein [Mycoplasma sp. HF11B]|uniref:BMP family ABC transporter substrate-binding protein n=1 Tax=unclassified Mycoplasma TaxID=2683645 RepID=UPI003AAC0487